MNMKKILAFALAFTFCFLCFGTYGFENATLCTEDHDHGMHVHAASDDVDVTVMVTVDSDYFPSSDKLVVTISVELSESVDVEEGSYLRFSYSGLGTPDVDGDDVMEDGSPTKSSTKVQFEADSDGDTFRDAVVTLTFDDLDEDDFKTYSTRRRSLKVYMSATPDDAGYDDIKFDSSLSQSHILYVCTHSGDTEEKTITPATCTKAGTADVVCSDCGYSLYTTMIFPLEHEFDYSQPFTNLYPYEAPTCYKTGKGQFKCKVCGDLDYVTVPKTHTFGQATINANGTYSYECTICGTIEVSDCAHNFKFTKSETLSTCTKKGVDIYTCSKCGETQRRDAELASHTYGEYTVTKKATCTTKGEKTRTCKVCAKKDTAEIDMTGHTYGEWRTIEESTCIADGIERRNCTVCDAVENKTIDRSGHKYGGWSVKTAPTCISTGTNEKKCSVCGDVQTQVTDKVGHTYGDWVETKAPTCVATGTAKQVCTVCSAENTKTVEIKEDAHAWSEWKSVVAKTCITDGLKSRTCTLCEYVEEDVDVATGHVFTPSVIEGKYTTKSCSCGYTEVIKSTKKGNEKTLTDYSGSLVITGANADKNIVFEATAMTMDTEAEYKKYVSFDKGYSYKVLLDGEATPITSDMTLTLKIDPSFEDYDVTLAILKGGAFLTLGEYERDGVEIEIDGAQLVGTDSIFVIKGEEQKPNLVLPIVITVAILAIAGVAVVVIMSKSKSKNTFN